MITTGQKVYHPKTTLYGEVTDVEGTHITVSIQDPVTKLFIPYVWDETTLEILDDEEFSVVKALTDAKKKKTELNKQVQEAQKEYGTALEKMLEYLDRVAVQGTRQYANVGVVTIVGRETHASITEENKEAAFAEIEAIGRGEIIKRTIHSGTLESFVSELKETGIPVPQHISTFETPKLSFAKRK